MRDKRRKKKIITRMDKTAERNLTTKVIKSTDATLDNHKFNISQVSLNVCHIEGTFRSLRQAAGVVCRLAAIVSKTAVMRQYWIQHEYILRPGTSGWLL
jgi:hypothetical protein